MYPLPLPTLWGDDGPLLGVDVRRPTTAGNGRLDPVEACFQCPPVGGQGVCVRDERNQRRRPVRLAA